MDIQRQSNEVIIFVITFVEIYHILCVFNLTLNILYPGATTELVS